jgi:hypothetical protein
MSEHVEHGDMPAERRERAVAREAARAALEAHADREAAHAALSDACLAWAKGQAGVRP